MKATFVSIVVPLLDGRPYVKGCLQSLMNQNYSKDFYEIILLDNGSTDGGDEIVEEYPVQLIRKPSPQGCGAARNAGIRMARGEMIAFTDIDCIADPGWLKNLVEGWEDPRFGGFVGRVLPVAPANPIEGWMADFYNQEENLHSRPLPFVQTNNVGYRREVFLRIGGFDQSLRWCEDADLSWRMLQQTAFGFKWNPKALIYHHNRSNLREVSRNFAVRGHGLAGMNKRHSRQFHKSTFFTAGHHFFKAFMQLIKLVLRLVYTALTGRDAEAILRVKF